MEFSVDPGRMILPFVWVRPEGGRVHNGLNFWSMTDPASRGVILKIWRLRARARYSIPQSRWLVSVEWVK